MIIHDDKTSELILDEENEILIFRWKRFSNFENIKKMHIMFYDVLKEREIEKLLVNNDKQGPISPEMMEWVKNDFFPMISKLNLKGQAVVYSEKAITNFALRKMDSDAADVAHTYKCSNEERNELVKKSIIKFSEINYLSKIKRSSRLK